MPDWFVVGKIVNTHGVRGEVRVISKTDFPQQRYAVGNKLYIDDANNHEKVELTIASHRTHKNFDLLRFEGLDNINDVEHFKNKFLKVPKEQLDDLEENEYYFYEIIGCDVYSEEGTYIGKVSDILTPGANDVWAVKTKENKEHFIPYIEDVVKDVDVKNKKIIIHVMEGLLD